MWRVRSVALRPGGTLLRQQCWARHKSHSMRPQVNADLALRAVGGFAGTSNQPWGVYGFLATLLAGLSAMGACVAYAENPETPGDGTPRSSKQQQQRLVVRIESSKNPVKQPSSARQQDTQPTRQPTKKLPEAELKKRYKVGEVLGEGTFAVVRAAVDRKLKERVAVKEINKDLSELDALENEIHIMERTGKHENVVSLRDVFDSKDVLYLVMDLAEGGELFDRIIERGELSEQVASSMFLTAVQGVHHLHQRNIAHLDIKPENLLLTSKSDDAGIKIADFGLAIDLSSYTRTSNERVLKECVGTPAYWSPEMVRNERFDEKVDIWALGCVLYILLTGAHPFDPMGDATEAQILAKVAKGKYDTTSPQFQAISAAAKDLIRHMLDPNPTTRYTTTQLLRHPWLAESGKLSASPLKADHITKLRGFRIIRLLRQGMQHMLGPAATDLFAVFDSDGDGFISREELGKALASIGQNLTKRELDAMIKAIDGNSDGLISREEFDIVLRAPPNSPYSSIRTRHTSLEDIEFLFRVFDRDRDGYIEHNDFIHVLGLLGVMVSESRVKRQIQTVDVDHDGKVDLAEFVAYWRLAEKERTQNTGFESVSPVYVKHRRTNRPVTVEHEAEEFAAAVH